MEMTAPERPGLGQPDCAEQRDRLIDDAQRGGDEFAAQHTITAGHDAQ
jgi:hypothetical protein